jgi:hypothetical protein
MYLIAFPLLLLPFVIYNMIVYLLGMSVDEQVFSIALLSGARLGVSIGTILVILGIVLLYFEILKATRLSSKVLMDHALSFILFVVMVIEFIAVEKAATTTFLILIALSFVDVIGGFTMSVRTARRDISLDHPERLAAGS